MHQLNNNRKFASGFSLIELSLALVVISSLVVLSLTKYTAQHQNEIDRQAISDLKTIRTAVQKYVIINGYYPCPADPSLASTDEALGRQLRANDGSCDNTNSHIQRSQESMARFKDSTDPDGTLGHTYFTQPPLIPNNNWVLLGAPPCKDIGLPVNCMFDPQGNRYSYAVVAQLAAIGVTSGNNSNIQKTCGQYIVTDSTQLGNNPEPGYTIQPVHGIRVLREYNDSSINIDDYYSDSSKAANYTYTDGDGTHKMEPDFIVIYYGREGYGAYPHEGGSRLQSAGGGSPNNFKEINSHLSTNFDSYFFMPDTPLDPSLVFGDIIAFGKNYTLSQDFCVRCGDCPAYANNYNKGRYMSVYCPGCKKLSDVCGATTSKPSLDLYCN